MNKLVAFSSVLVLAAGCAHREYSERVSVSTPSSSTTYGYSGGPSTSATYDYSTGPTMYGYTTNTTLGYPVYTLENDVWNNGIRDSDYSNTSKGAGARALKANPFESSPDYTYSRNYTYTAPAGAAVV